MHSTLDGSGLLSPSTENPIYELETERLLFRRLQESDLEPYHNILSNHDAMTYMSHAPHTDYSQTIALLSEPTDPMVDCFALCLKSPSLALPPQLIGTMGSFQNDIGYVLHPSCWRQGIGSEAMKAFLERFWKTWPEVESLGADVDPRNTASLRLLEKFGFVEIGKKEGTYNTHIGLCDSVYLRLDRPASESLE